MTPKEKELAEKLLKRDTVARLRKDHEFPLYSVKVCKDGIFNPPFAYPDDVHALECYCKWLKDHPEAKDYSLYRIGSYNMIDGKFTSVDAILIYDPKANRCLKTKKKTPKKA